MALRFGLYFGTSPEFWLNLQTHYDLKMARKNLMPEAVARIKAQRAAWRIDPTEMFAGG
jgi:plasmid maintenance system antidote protein VapI